MSANRGSCWHAESGLAIGPILFIVALLGILAAVISAGGGGFTASSQQEAARANAAAMLQIGNALKTGFVRLIGSGIDFDAVEIDVASTVNDADLFSPSGGNVNIPSVTLANNPVADIWYFPAGAVPRLGTSATDRLALLKVASALCDEINRKGNGVTAAVSDGSMAADIGDVTAATLAGAADWPAPLYGHEAGCLRNTNAVTPGTFYFQVLGIR